MQIMKSSKALTSPIASKSVSFKGVNTEKIFNPNVVLDKFLSEDVIDFAVKSNDNIEKILKANNIATKVNMENITGASQRHFETTYEAAMELAKKNGVKGSDYANLQKGALLHDIGKSLIPTEIIGKPGRLDPHEREIINLHSQLGKEILSTTPLDKSVSNIAWLHHAPIQNVEKARDDLSQIVSVADVYSALSEVRPYKPAMSFEKIQDIMTHDEKLKQGYVTQLLGAVKEGFLEKKC